MATSAPTELVREDGHVASVESPASPPVINTAGGQEQPEILMNAPKTEMSQEALQQKLKFDKHREMYETFRRNKLEGKGFNSPAALRNQPTQSKSVSPIMSRKLSPKLRKKSLPPVPSESQKKPSCSLDVPFEQKPVKSEIKLEPEVGNVPSIEDLVKAECKEEILEVSESSTDDSETNVMSPPQIPFESNTPSSVPTEEEKNISSESMKTSKTSPEEPIFSLSPPSASMTPGDDSGEERNVRPLDSEPAQKSDASPSSVSFSSSRSASPTSRQQSMEEELPAVVGTDSVEPVEAPVPTPPEAPRRMSEKVKNRYAKLHEKQKKAAERATRLEQEQKEKAQRKQEKHRQRSIKWYTLRLLEYGSQTESLDEKTMKKVKNHIKRRLNEDSKFLTCRIPLTTKFVDEGDYRRCHEYLMSTTCSVDLSAQKRPIEDDSVGTKIKKTESGKSERIMAAKGKPPSSVPMFSLYGDLLVPLDVTANQLLEKAGRRISSRRNEIYKTEKGLAYPYVPPPKPDSKLLEEEMQFYRKQMNNGLNAEMKRVMEKMEDFDTLRLPCPELCVSTSEEVHDPNFKRVLLATSITNVDGFGKALGIDFSKFTIEAINAAHPELIMDELDQCPQSANYNYDIEGNRTWYAKSENRYLKVKTFTEDYISRRSQATEYFKKFVKAKNWVKAEEKIAKELLDNRYVHPDDDASMFYSRFGTNIDIQQKENFAEQLREIEKIPEFMKPEREGNLINLPIVGQTIFGVNTVQMYVKPPGARTCAHMENALMASINWNVGPGTCVWYAVPYEYYGKLKKLIKLNEQSYFNQDYWPDEQELLANGIPVIKFEQKADQLVYVNTGCFHWVQSNGFCANVSWNVGQPTFTQLATTMISYSDDLEGGHQHHFPLVATCWRYAKEKMYIDNEDMYKVIRSILIRSFAHSKMKYDVAVTAGTDIYYRDERPDFFHLNRCYQCMQEIFNVLNWWVIPNRWSAFSSVEKNLADIQAEDKAKEEAEAKGIFIPPKAVDLFSEKHCAFCDRCAKHIHKEHNFRTETTMYYSLEEMAEIFDNYRRPTPEISIPEKIDN